MSSLPKVYITDYIDDPYIEKDILQDGLADSCHEGIEVLIVWHEIIDRAYMEKLPHLKGIVRYGVGYENVDLEYASSRNIAVCNTPDYGVEEVSDTAIAMIMNIARGNSRYDFQCRAYRDSWQEHTIQPLRRTSELTLGVIGAGRIGGSIITKANALRFKTMFIDPYKPRGYEKMLRTHRVDLLDDLLKAADIVSVNTPLTEETHAMVDEDFISKMKEGASFINTARGKIVKNIDSFYAPLKSGALSNVALDVLPEEPPKDSELIDAWRAREEWLEGRVIISPHASYYSQEAYIEMREKAASNALRILKGEAPFNLLNAEGGQRGKYVRSS